MSLELKCSSCKRLYLCSKLNTRVHGSRLSTRCPFCNELLEKNVSSYVEEQCFLGGIQYGYYPRARLMIKMAQGLAAIVNDDVPYTESKKKKKDELPDI